MNVAKLIVNKHSLNHNFQIIKKKIPGSTKILIVLKANAYGLGSVDIAKYALELGADSLGVARVEEGIELRENGIESSILIFANTYPERFREIVDYNLEATITDLDVLKSLVNYLNNEKKTVKVHLKINTGMNRLGFEPDELEYFLDLIKLSKYIDLKGIYTHFSSADEKHIAYTQNQNEIFKKIYDKYKPLYPNVLFHAANSAALMNFPDTHYDMVRSGILFFGSYPSEIEELSWHVKHVIQLQAQVIQVKSVKAGSYIGYNRTFKTKKNSKVATIGIGYGDGVNRFLSNRGHVLIRGEKFPIIGKVSMDQLMVDISGENEVKIADNAILIGDYENEKLKLHHIAKSINTVPYEILTSLSPRVKRIYTEL